MSMNLGEKAELTIAPDKAYGAIGNPPNIPGNATLIFEVELLKIDNSRPTRWMMSDAELIRVAVRCKEDGNAKFKLSQWKPAEGYYRDGLAYLKTAKNDNVELRKLRTILLQNIATVCNKSGDYRQAVRNATDAINGDAQAMKAFYQRSIANLHLHYFGDALEDCKAAIKLNPQEASLRAHYEHIKKE